MNYLNKVTKFHKTFDVPIVDKPSIPEDDRCELRINLMQQLQWTSFTKRPRTIIRHFRLNKNMLTPKI